MLLFYTLFYTLFMKSLHVIAKFKLQKSVITRFTKTQTNPTFGLTTIVTSSVMDFNRNA